MALKLGVMSLTHDTFLLATYKMATSENIAIYIR